MVDRLTPVTALCGFICSLRLRASSACLSASVIGLDVEGCPVADDGVDWFCGIICSVRVRASAARFSSSLIGDALGIDDPLGVAWFGGFIYSELRRSSSARLSASCPIAVPLATRMQVPITNPWIVFMLTRLHADDCHNRDMRLQR